MTSPPPPPRRRGAARTEALLDVTLELASEVGYRGLTIEAIARKAGVGKHTIYRRWSSISELLLDALNHVWVTDLDYLAGGDVREDLREQFIRSSVALSQPPIGPIYRAVIADAQSDPGLRATLHERFLSTVEQRTLDRIRAAQRQGQLRADVDLRYPAEVLAGTLYYRWLLTPLPVDEEAIDGLIGMFMEAYGVETRAQRRARHQGAAMASQHISIEIDRPASAVYAFAADPTNLPRWAAGLAGTEVVHEGTHWHTESTLGRVTFTFAPPNDFAVLDHDVTLPTGETVHNPMRVIPTDTGSEVVFTLRRRPGMTDEEYADDTAAVEADLATLKALMETT